MRFTHVFQACSVIKIVEYTDKVQTAQNDNSRSPSCAAACLVKVAHAAEGLAAVEGLDDLGGLQIVVGGKHRYTAETGSGSGRRSGWSDQARCRFHPRKKKQPSHALCTL